MENARRRLAFARLKKRVEIGASQQNASTGGNARNRVISTHTVERFNVDAKVTRRVFARQNIVGRAFDGRIIDDNGH